MSRVINLNDPTKIRNQNRRAIAEIFAPPEPEADDGRRSARHGCHIGLSPA
jgi:hypothetical protein